MTPHAVCMSFQETLPVRLVFSVHIVHISRQGHFGIYDHITSCIQMQNHVRSDCAAGIRPDRTAGSIPYRRLDFIVDSRCQSLGFKQLGQYCLTPVSLDLGPAAEHPGKFIRTFFRSLALSDHIFHGSLHDTAHLGLFQSAVIHGLFHPGYRLFQRVHYLPQICTARLGELLLSLFQHVIRSRCHLCRHFLQRFVKLLLKSRHRLRMAFLLLVQLRSEHLGPGHQRLAPASPCQIPGHRPDDKSGQQNNHCLHIYLRFIRPHRPMSRCYSCFASPAV